MTIGSRFTDKSCEFVVWAPVRDTVSLLIDPEGKSEPVPMKKDPKGYWKVSIGGIRPDFRYVYRLDEEIDRPDPASHFQPRGVHKASQIVDHEAFRWSDDGWRGVKLSTMIIYELHVGTFTPNGNFESLVSRLNDLLDLGVNAIEIMPLAQFPGERNWGYDGVYPYAVQNSYGGPNELKNLVNRCHNNGIAVILDVVYNHLGPEGNYFGDYGPYFTDKYKTFWGRALNFDDAYCDEVKKFFIENALFWFYNYHIDALRLDAVHSIFDMSAKPFLLELAEAVNEFSKKDRKRYLIAESDLNDMKIINPKGKGGYGIDAQWLDDFHHSLHSLLVNEDQGYYADFGSLQHLAKALVEGFVYSGEYSRYRLRRHGNSSKPIQPHKFVVFSQNHDQVGNRMLGERLSTLASFEATKLAAATVMLSPYIPMLFMGEEYGEESPFLYFVDHSDLGLIEAVRKGRVEEFKGFRWKGDAPDPQDPTTLQRSKIMWERRNEGKPQLLLGFYKYLIKLRKSVPALCSASRRGFHVSASEPEKTVFVQRNVGGYDIRIVFNFSDREIDTRIDLPRQKYQKILDSSDKKWGGKGSRLSEIIANGEPLILNGKSVCVLMHS